MQVFRTAVDTRTLVVKLQWEQQEQSVTIDNRIVTGFSDQLYRSIKNEHVLAELNAVNLN